MNEGKPDAKATGPVIGIKQKKPIRAQSRRASSFMDEVLPLRERPRTFGKEFMNTPTHIRAVTASFACWLSLLVFGGCATSKTAALSDDLRQTSFSGTRGKSLYAMAVSDEAKRLRKADPTLSQKDAMAKASRNVSPDDYSQTETPEEKKARELKEAQKEFAAKLEKSMAR